MDPLELVPVYETTDPTEAEVLKVVLEAEGLKCVIENEHQAGLTGILPMRLLVAAKDADRAHAVLAHGEKER